MEKPRKYPRTIVKAVTADGREITFDPPVNVYQAAAEASKTAK